MGIWGKLFGRKQPHQDKTPEAASPRPAEQPLAGIYLPAAEIWEHIGSPNVRQAKRLIMELRPRGRRK